MLESRTAARHCDLASRGLLRRLASPCGIDLCSNDYLGLAEHELIKKRMADAVLREGCGSGGSRLLRGQRADFRELEKRFARFKGSEAALYFSSGYLANLAVLSTFLEPGDVVFSDSLNHASLIDGIRLGRAQRVIFEHSDTASLNRCSETTACGGQRFIVAESVYSMDGDFAPLREYTRIAAVSHSALIVDEAHAVGIYGAGGVGLIEATDVFLSINPMGKAFGCAGAFVCGPAWAIEHLVQCSRPFIFSTAPPPAIAAALDAAMDLIENGGELRCRLSHLTQFLRGLLADRALNVAREGSHIIPVVIGGNSTAVAVAKSLQDSGFDVRAIRPPTVPEGTARLRISVNVKLTERVLTQFADALAGALRSAAA